MREALKVTPDAKHPGTLKAFAIICLCAVIVITLGGFALWFISLLVSAPPSSLGDIFPPR